MSKIKESSKQEEKMRSLHGWLKKEFGDNYKEHILTPKELLDMNLPAMFKERNNHVHHITGKDKKEKKLNFYILSTFQKAERDRNFFNFECFYYLVNHDIADRAYPRNFTLAHYEGISGKSVTFVMPIIDILHNWNNSIRGFGLYAPGGNPAGDAIWIDHDVYESWNKHRFK